MAFFTNVTAQRAHAAVDITKTVPAEADAQKNTGGDTSQSGSAESPEASGAEGAVPPAPAQPQD
ncbi:MAG: hypothetical protein M0P39_07695 [Rhodocyclaceae bacterium]|nr:hypothetical protein [Rhodocyclaceae bacterium]